MTDQLVRDRVVVRHGFSAALSIRLRTIHPGRAAGKGMETAVIPFPPWAGWGSPVKERAACFRLSCEQGKNPVTPELSEAGSGRDSIGLFRRIINFDDDRRLRGTEGSSRADRQYTRQVYETDGTPGLRSFCCGMVGDSQWHNPSDFKRKNLVKDR